MTLTATETELLASGRVKVTCHISQSKGWGSGLYPGEQLSQICYPGDSKRTARTMARTLVEQHLQNGYVPLPQPGKFYFVVVCEVLDRRGRELLWEIEVVCSGRGDKLQVRSPVCKS